MLNLSVLSLFICFVVYNKILIAYINSMFFLESSASKNKLLFTFGSRCTPVRHIKGKKLKNLRIRNLGLRNTILYYILITIIVPLYTQIRS